MKRAMTLLAFASLVLVACVGSQTPVPNSATVVEDGIEYYLETDKSSYTLGESVRIRYRVTNKTDEVKEFGSVPNCTSCIQQFHIVTGDTEVWRSCRITPPCGFRVLRLNPRESWEFSEIAWSMVNDNGTLEPDDDFPIVPGEYSLVGELWHFGEARRKQVSTSFEIK